MLGDCYIIDNLEQAKARWMKLRKDRLDAVCDLRTGKRYPVTALTRKKPTDPKHADAKLLPEKYMIFTMRGGDIVSHMDIDMQIASKELSPDEAIGAYEWSLRRQIKTEIFFDKTRKILTPR
jgi:hypothetical protein